MRGGVAQPRKSFMRGSETYVNSGSRGNTPLLKKGLWAPPRYYTAGNGRDSENRRTLPVYCTVSSVLCRDEEIIEIWVTRVPYRRRGKEWYGRTRAGQRAHINMINGQATWHLVGVAFTIILRHGYSQSPRI